MIFFANALGSITKIINEPVYQNSHKANDITLIAPFASNCAVAVAFTLPNGVRTSLNLASPNMGGIDLGECDIQNASNVKYNAWTYTLDRSITENAGTVNVQFYVCSGSGNTLQILATYTSNFFISRGVKFIPPELLNNQGENLYEQVLARLSELETQFSAFKKPTEIRLVGDAGTLTADDYVSLIENFPFSVINLDEGYTLQPYFRSDTAYYFQQLVLDTESGQEYVGSIIVEISFSSRDWKMYKIGNELETRKV